MPSSVKLALKYGLFAVIATLANLGSQEIAVRTYQGPFEVYAALLVGTFVGLVVKYVLDKKYIFGFRAHSFAEDASKFSAYALLGVATTAVFWAFEMGFHYLYGTAAMRYLGGAIGLALGYALKYELDRRFVFRSESV